MAASPLWIFPPQNPHLLKELTQELNISPVIAQVLISRGFTSTSEIHEFLYGKLPQLYDPDLFPDMDSAVDRILGAIEKKEAILIYGDNDVDGMTAAALLTEFLQSLQARVFFDIPKREALKKSMMGDALSFAEKLDCKLLITVDCGITAAKEIEEVIAHGIDVIVTDHHEPTSKIPHCIATLNPKLINSTYPNRELTGVGVAFKLIHAIANRLSEQADPPVFDLKRYLDLVALGLIGDMAPLKGENRILVRYGLKEMQEMKRVGLAKLFALSDLETKTLSPMDIASKIAPRLNSLGRIADPAKGVELLLIQGEKEAEDLAKELDINNLERQRIERIAFEEMEGQLFESPDLLAHKAIVIASKNWHPGIIAILAARIAKQYNRPAIVIAIDEGVGKGSIRTISEFPLLTVLKENEDLLINFGGHDYAAGLLICEDKLPLFRKNFIAAAEKELTDRDVTPKLHLDAKVNFSELTFDLLESLSLLEPFGHENPAPILYCDVMQIWPPKVVGKYHLKLFLEQGDRALEGIALGQALKKEELARKNMALRIAFTPQINVFRGKPSIQLMIKDIQVITTSSQAQQ